MLSHQKRNSWSYPALRAWAKAQNLPDHRIDTMIISARREKAPLWAVEKRNGRWALLTKDVPVDIEHFFVRNQADMYDLARNNVAA